MAKDRALIKRMVQGSILAYRWILSPILGYHCRFMPSCSVYALDAVERWGVIRGCGYVVYRLARCHPWSAGGYDPVPPAPSKTEKR